MDEMTPAATPAATPTTPTPTPAPVAAPATAPTGGPSVLIAEDEEFLRKILAQAFSDAGFTVHEAVNGKQAVDLALANKPTVTVLDIMMPEMDGMEALKKIRLDMAWGASAMVIMLTNLTADNKILEQMAESSPSYYFVKSDMEPDQLVAKVREMLQQIPA